jgi:hypothetical protein
MTREEKTALLIWGGIHAQQQLKTALDTLVETEGESAVGIPPASALLSSTVAQILALPREEAEPAMLALRMHAESIGLGSDLTDPAPSTPTKPSDA